MTTALEDARHRLSEAEAARMATGVENAGLREQGTRLQLVGISRTGSGAPSASGLKKLRGLRMAPM